MTVTNRPDHILRLVTALVTSLPLAIQAQTSSPVQNLGTAPAQQVSQSLGFDIDQTADWEFEAVRNVGGTWVRADCTWTSVEVQTPNNTSGGYVLPSGCAAVLKSARKWNEEVNMNALYGPPFQRVATLETASSYPKGTSHIRVGTGAHINLETLAEKCFDKESKPLCEVMTAANRQISGRFDYSGTLLTRVDVPGQAIETAAATNIPITQGEALVVNQLLYSPILLPTGAAFQNDRSTLAYVHYAEYLQSQVAAAGLSGAIGLWNEPNWSGGIWLHGQLFYDAPPARYLPTDSVNIGVLMAVAANLPAHITVPFINNFTNKTASGSAFGLNNLYRKYTTAAELKRAFQSESFHPYGNNPEDQMWNLDCIRQKAISGPSNVEKDCALPGGITSANIKDLALFNYLPISEGGLPQSITETGTATGGAANSYRFEDARTRFDLRQFLGYSALGVSPVMFYKISCSHQGYDWVNCSSHEPYKVYKAFKSLMSDIKSISQPPSTRATQCLGPRISSFHGSYPLDTAEIVGSKPNSSPQSSILFFAWQQTYVQTGNWYSMESPAPAAITVNIPENMAVVKVTDLVNLSPVKYYVNGQVMSYEVADNPIEVWLEARAKKGTDATCPGVPIRH